MTAPNMAAITASLERSLQNCSINHHHQSSSGSDSSSCSNTGYGFRRSDSPENIHSSDNATLELNSHISLPYHWEQCLDLKTGEVYYINWRTGMKAKEDPRTSNEYDDGTFYSDDDSSYDSEGSSPEPSPASSSRERLQQQYHHHDEDERERGEETRERDHVLVVAGCKSCLMYFMVPKQVGTCPKCTGQLLHFDRSDDGGSP